MKNSLTDAELGAMLGQLIWDQAKSNIDPKKRKKRK
jgi:hypothetical protein